MLFQICFLFYVEHKQRHIILKILSNQTVDGGKKNKLNNTGVSKVTEF